MERKGLYYTVGEHETVSVPWTSTMDKKQPSRRSPSRLFDLLWELLIATAIVGALITGAFFVGAHQNSSWMPPPEIRQRIAWSLGGLGLGAMYLYLAVSTRRLERRLSNMPQLRQFISFGQRWFISLGISGLFLIFGVWSLCPVVQQYELRRAPAKDSAVHPAVFQFAAGLIWMLSGASILKLRIHLANRKSAGQETRLSSYLLPVGMVAYGAVQFISGVLLFLKSGHR